MKVLVTGANGLLATHVIKVLSEAGIAVVGLLRQKEKYLLPLHNLVELREGDICDSASVKDAMHGCTHVIHAAAFTGQTERRFDRYLDVNVNGTENLLRLATQMNIHRFVFVSTANTLGYGTSVSPGDEWSVMKKPFTHSLYARSKQMAEALLHCYRDRLNIVTVHPSFMIGSFDAAPSSGQIFSAVLKRRMVFVPPGGKNFVYVADVAAGVKNALLFGTRGEKYLLCNENLSYRQFFKLVASCTGTTPWFIPLPFVVLSTLGVLGDLLRLFRVNTMVSSTNMRILCVNNFYSNAKAKRDLGLTFQSTEVAIADALAWWAERKGEVSSVHPETKRADVSTGSFMMSSPGD